MDKGHAALRAAPQSRDGGMVHAAVRILSSSLLTSVTAWGQGEAKDLPGWARPWKGIPSPHGLYE